MNTLKVSCKVTVDLGQGSLILLGTFLCALSPFIEITSHCFCCCQN